MKGKNIRKPEKAFANNVKRDIGQGLDSPLTERINKLEAWLKKNTLYVAVVLFLAALAPRISYYQEIKNSPVQVFVSWDQGDLEFFHSWAKVIASGNWLSDTVLHPYHSWHDDFSKGTFKTYPEVAARYYAAHTDVNSQIDTLGARHNLINDLYNKKVFHQEPLYPYLIALTYKIVGEDPNRVYAWQMALGICTILLIYFTGLRLFGALSGLLAALVVLLSGPVMFFEVILLRTSITVFFTALLLYLFIRVVDKPDWRNLILWGIAAGLALMCQSYLLLFLLTAWVWLAWLWRDRKIFAVQRLAGFAAALLIVMTPVFYRNSKVGAPIGSLASNAAMTYIPLNSNQALPLESFYFHEPTAVKIMHETEGRMGATMRACLATFKNFEDFSRLYRQKIEGIFMTHEMHSNVNYYFYKEFSPMLKAMPALFFLFAPIGLAGIFLGIWRHRARFVPVLLMTLVSIAPMLIGGSLSRYRAALCLSLAVAAAYFVIELVKMIAKAQWKWVVPLLILCTLLYELTSGLPSKALFPYIPSDFNILYRDYYMPRLKVFEEKGEFEKHNQLTKELLGHVPDYFFRVKIDDPIINGNDAECSKIIIRYLTMYATTSDRIGRNEEARQARMRCEVLKKRIDDFDLKVKNGTGI
ncbi:MAG: glycosyltransferase family 39 protein [Saprospiraceae bacterium]